jgi:hypothetical protein
MGFYPLGSMAVDFNTLKMLFWAKNLGASFDRVLTLGHQGLLCSPAQLRKASSDFGRPLSREDIERCFRRPTFGSVFADELFRCLGAREVVSVDKSDFESATLLHDLNEPFPAEHQGQYDFVFDGGTLEHIFNYPTALRNTLELVRPGGHFLTIPPAQNLMGHGFYQISPELFFRVLSPENGFVLRKLTIHDSEEEDATFYEVHDPALTGSRTDLNSSHPMYLAALAQRTEVVPVLQKPPQQSDYSALWSEHRTAQAAGSEGAPKRFARLRRALNPYWPNWLLRWKRELLFSWKRGAPRLSNQQHFRKLSQLEICQERANSKQVP